MVNQLTSPQDVADNTVQAEADTVNPKDPEQPQGEIINELYSQKSENQVAGEKDDRGKGVYRMVLAGAPEQNIVAVTTGETRGWFARALGKVWPAKAEHQHFLEEEKKKQEKIERDKKNVDNLYTKIKKEFLPIYTQHYLPILDGPGTFEEKQKKINELPKIELEGRMKETFESLSFEAVLELIIKLLIDFPAEMLKEDTFGKYLERATLLWRYTKITENNITENNINNNVLFLASRTTTFTKTDIDECCSGSRGKGTLLLMLSFILQQKKTLFFVDVDESELMVKLLNIDIYFYSTYKKDQTAGKRNFNFFNGIVSANNQDITFTEAIAQPMVERFRELKPEVLYKLLDYFCKESNDPKWILDYLDHFSGLNNEDVISYILNKNHNFLSAIVLSKLDKFKGVDKVKVFGLYLEKYLKEGEFPRDMLVDLLEELDQFASVSLARFKPQLMELSEKGREQIMASRILLKRPDIFELNEEELDIVIQHDTTIAIFSTSGNQVVCDGGVQTRTRQEDLMHAYEKGINHYKAMVIPYLDKVEALKLLGQFHTMAGNVQLAYINKILRRDIGPEKLTIDQYYETIAYGLKRGNETDFIKQLILQHYLYLLESDKNAVERYKNADWAAIASYIFEYDKKTYPADSTRKAYLFRILAPFYSWSSNFLRQVFISNTEDAQPAVVQHLGEEVSKRVAWSKVIPELLEGDIQTGFAIVRHGLNDKTKDYLKRRGKLLDIGKMIKDNDYYVLRTLEKRLEKPMTDEEKKDLIAKLQKVFKLLSEAIVSAEADETELICLLKEFGYNLGGVQEIEKSFKIDLDEFLLKMIDVDFSMVTTGPLRPKDPFKIAIAMLGKLRKKTYLFSLANPTGSQVYKCIIWLEKIFPSLTGENKKSLIKAMVEQGYSIIPDELTPEDIQNSVIIRDYIFHQFHEYLTAEEIEKDLLVWLSKSPQAHEVFILDSNVDNLTLEQQREFVLNMIQEGEYQGVIQQLGRFKDELHKEIFTMLSEYKYYKILLENLYNFHEVTAEMRVKLLYETAAAGRREDVECALSIIPSVLKIDGDDELDFMVLMSALIKNDCADLGVKNIHLFTNITAEQYQKIFFDIVQYGKKQDMEALFQNLHIFETKGLMNLVELAKVLVQRGYADMVRRYKKKFKGAWSNIEEFLL